MDQIDAILRLKNCFKELEEIDIDQSYSCVSQTRGLIAQKMHEIAKILDLSKSKPNVPKPQGSLRPHKIHGHPYWEKGFDLVNNHVIIDREIYNQLLEKWDQIEEYLIRTAVVI